MDFKQIQELMILVNDYNIGEVWLELKDFKITIKQKEENQPQFVSGMQLAPFPNYQQQPFQQQALPSASLPGASSEAAAIPSTTITIKSPMIGTFYKRPSPDKPNFLEVGDEVTPGKVVCIIEAMKLFNEIESEVSGKVVKILVEDSSPVEYDQPLFLVEPA